MLIKELEDVLLLVDQLPRQEQLKCAMTLALYVDDWEARSNEPSMSDREWAHLKFRRRQEMRERRQK